MGWVAAALGPRALILYARAAWQKTFARLSIPVKKPKLEKQSALIY
jgi:hypothetical protein